MEAADGHRVIEQDAMIGHVDRADGDLPVLGEGVPGGNIERGVRGKIVALVRVPTPDPARPFTNPDP